jgi:hypothetical protein
MMVEPLSKASSSFFPRPDVYDYRSKCNCGATFLGAYMGALWQLAIVPRGSDPNMMSINHILLKAKMLPATIDSYIKMRSNSNLPCTACRPSRGPLGPPLYQHLLDACAQIEERREGRLPYSHSGYLCLRCIKHQVCPGDDTKCNWKHEERGVESQPIRNIVDQHYDRPVEL